MTRTCRCGDPATEHLTIRYQYPRAEYLPEAADPRNVLGSAPVITCGSVACEAEALLAVQDQVITDVAVNSGHLLSAEDVRIIHVGRPGEAPFGTVDDH
jgi:hypothetical protein